jgi:DNA-binding transcriptional MerR regulator
MAEQQGFGVPEVLRAVKISYRQLDYWARTGLVRPSIRDAGGSGTQRLYSFQDLVQLRVIKQLLDTGVSLQKIRQATDFMQDMKVPAAGTTLVSDGTRVYAEESPDVLLDLLASGQGVFAIAVDKVWMDLEKTLSKTRGKTSREIARAGGA